MQQENIREEFEEFMNNSGREGVNTRDQMVADWFLSRTISKQDIEKFVEEKRPNGDASNHNTYNDGKRDFADDLLTHIKNK